MHQVILYLQSVFWNADSCNNYSSVVCFHASTRIVALDSNYRSLFRVNSLLPDVIKIKEEIIQLNITINLVDTLTTVI